MRCGPGRALKPGHRGIATDAIGSRISRLTEAILGAKEDIAASARG